MKRRGTTLALTVVALARAARAEESATYPGPPATIDDAETVEPGHLELNLTLGFAGNRRRSESELPLVDANYGLVDNVHVNAEIPYVALHENGAWTSGLGRAAVAVKLRVVDRSRVALAFHPEVELPPLPSLSVEEHGNPVVTLPAVLDLAVGDRGAGLGFQLSRSFTKPAGDDLWGGAVGFATPLDASNVVMFDCVGSVDTHFEHGVGTFEVSYLHSNLFGEEHLTLLTLLGESTEGDLSAVVGVRIWL